MTEGLKNACQQNIGITYYGNDDDPIAVEPQLDEDELDGDSDDANVQEEIISAEPHKGSAD